MSPPQSSCGSSFIPPSRIGSASNRCNSRGAATAFLLHLGGGGSVSKSTPEFRLGNAQEFEKHGGLASWGISVGRCGWEGLVGESEGQRVRGSESWWEGAGEGEQLFHAGMNEVGLAGMLIACMLAPDLGLVGEEERLLLCWTKSCTICILFSMSAAYSSSL